MKKIINILAFLMISGIVFADDIWERKLIMGYKNIPGKYYYIDAITSYNNGLYVSTRYEQNKISTNQNLFKIRFSNIKKLNSFNYGFETGMDISASKSSKEWAIRSKSNYTGDIRWLYITNYAPNNGKNLLVTQIFNTDFAIPLLFRIEFSLLKNIKANLSIGEYIISQTEKTSRDYSDNYSPSADADDEVRNTFITIKPIIELTPEINWKIAKNINFGANIELGYIPEYTLKEKFMDPHKMEYKIGGITYGGAVSLNLDF